MESKEERTAAKQERERTRAKQGREADQSWPKLVEYVLMRAGQEELEADAMHEKAESTVEKFYRERLRDGVFNKDETASLRTAISALMAVDEVGALEVERWLKERVKPRWQFLRDLIALEHEGEGLPVAKQITFEMAGGAYMRGEGVSIEGAGKGQSPVSVDEFLGLRKF